ncbi:hypothetical protein TI04_00215 [Achromatium sp. WMS2]|nr:hypothetical protein TI04_00215 [Achromatium sp. WMS2]
MQQKILILLLQFLSLLPWPIIQGVGWLIGQVLARIPNRQRRDVLINIRLCLPQLSSQEQVRLRHKTMINFARTYVELAALWFWKPERVLKLVKLETNIELLQHKPGCGIIVLTPHLGAWELAGLYMTKYQSITSMYRPQSQHYGLLDALILKARQRSGAILVPDNSIGIKKLLIAIKDGQNIGILPDQVTRETTGSVFAPFFGRPAVTMLLVAGLARRSGAKVVFIFAERLPWCRGFHIRCLPAPDGIDSADDQVAANALNQGVENCIKHCVEQYQWTYRRFRRLPEQQPNPYNGPLI